MDTKVQELIMPSRTLEVTFGQNDYIIQYPNNGQFIDLEIRIIQLSESKMTDLLKRTNSSSVISYILIETIAFIEVCMPQVIKDLNKDSLLNLPVHETLPLLVEYREKIQPWLVSWESYLNQEIEKLFKS